MITFRVEKSIRVAQALFAACKDELEPKFQYLGVVCSAINRSEWCASWWDGEVCIGGAFGSYATMHIAIVPSYRGRWLTKYRFLEFLDWFFARHTIMSLNALSPTAKKMFEFCGAHPVDDMYILQKQAYLHRRKELTT